jgi:beta-glucanase (GH16 family)
MNKYLIVLLAFMLLLHQLQAQPSKDSNWDPSPLFFDDFVSPRSPWSNDHWMDDPNDNKWKAHLCGDVTHGTSERMVYQRENAIFNASDNTMVLRAEYAGELIDTSEYDIPLYGMKHPGHGPLYYRSGALCVGLSGMEKFLYGYFEIRCRLPVNLGAFPAFWLWDHSDNNYREIDVFEYSWLITDNGGVYGSPRYFEGQIYYGTDPPSVGTYGQHGYLIPNYSDDLTGWHTYSVEWTPGRVLWFFDDLLIGSYSGDCIPSMSMNLVINNAVDNYATPGGIPVSEGFPNEMVIDYIEVKKLKCDCYTDASILNNNQLNGFDYQVYQSITIGGTGSDIDVPSNSSVVFRATNEITINGDFEVPVGTSLELITHACPQ